MIPDWSSDDVLSEDTIKYFNHGLRNRVYGELIKAFAEAVTKNNGTRKGLAKRVDMDPSQVTRLLAAPSNLTLDTISTFLLGIGAELETEAVFQKDRAAANFSHWLIDALDSPSSRISPYLAPGDIITETPLDDFGATGQNDRRFKLAS